MPQLTPKVRSVAAFRAVLAGVIATHFAACDVFGPSSGALRWETLSGGRWFTCGIASGGSALYCWGRPPGGVRDGYPPFSTVGLPGSSVPRLVQGPPAELVSVSVGESSVCVLTSAQGVHCVGWNTHGQLGTGTYNGSADLVPVVGEQRWSSVVVGVGGRACGIATTGETYCWGNQFRGQLGNGETLGSSPVPVEIYGGHRFVSLGAGGGFTCGLSDDGSVHCWGTNDFGNLGDGGPVQSGAEVPVPSRVVGEHSFRDLFVGYGHACALDDERRAYCWGENSAGQLGDGTVTSRSEPTAVLGAERWQYLTLGDWHSCGRTIDGRDYCWGRNGRGQFGNGSTDSSLEPLRVEWGELSDFVAGGEHMCGRRSDGTAMCWGRGDYSQLGVGEDGNRYSPSRVRPPR